MINLKTPEEMQAEFKALLERLPVINGKFILRYIDKRKDFKTDYIEAHSQIVHEFGQDVTYYSVNEFSPDLSANRIAQFKNGELQILFDADKLSTFGKELQREIKARNK